MNPAYRYVSDVLNMSQGVYIFLIFVCKRQVMDAVLGKKRSARLSAKLSKRGHGDTKRRGRGGTRDSSTEPGSSSSRSQMDSVSRLTHGTELLQMTSVCRESHQEQGAGLIERA